MEVVAEQDRKSWDVQGRCADEMPQVSLFEYTVRFNPWFKFLKIKMREVVICTHDQTFSSLSSVAAYVTTTISLWFLVMVVGFFFVKELCSPSWTLLTNVDYLTLIIVMLSESKLKQIKYYLILVFVSFSNHCNVFF